MSKNYLLIYSEQLATEIELLCQNTGRKWYEADLDYDSGFRNEKRLLYSNDGLIFVSYDHAQTFYEIIK